MPCLTTPAQTSETKRVTAAVVQVGPRTPCAAGRLGYQSHDADFVGMQDVGITGPWKVQLNFLKESLRKQVVCGRVVVSASSPRQVICSEVERLKLQFAREVAVRSV